MIFENEREVPGMPGSGARVRNSTRSSHALKRHMPTMRPATARALSSASRTLSSSHTASRGLSSAAASVAQRNAAAIAEAGAAKGLRFYQFSFVDLFGVQRSKLVPASRVEEIATDGAGFAGFAAWLDMDPTMGDLLAMPDPSTLTQLPWQRDVGWLSCDLVHEGGELPHGPRNVLRAVQAKLKAAHGLTLKTGVECEFFLLDGGSPSPSVADALDVQSKPCYDSHALMRRYDLISTLVEAMEEPGWGPYQADHEDANGQFEINWDYEDALITADRVTLFKYMARTLAERHGLRATFMPKPFAQLTGSGSHAHMSLWDAATGKCVSGGGDASMHGLSPTSLFFLAGVLSNAPALLALTNPTVNSYKRLNARGTASGATWSPTAATWAGNNRSALVRVPGGATRMELRVADMSANPYLMAAAIGAAGLDGLKKGAPPPPPCDRNMYDTTDPVVAAAVAAAPPLPTELPAALDLLESSTALRDGLGEPFVDSYLKLRRAHCAEYAAQLTPWELQTYLDS